MSGSPEKSEVLYIADVQRELRCGEFTARRILRRIGRRLNARRLVCTREALQKFLAQQGGSSEAP